MTPIALFSLTVLVALGEPDTLELNEVTQPSLAVSIDGELLYFAVLGDLVSIPATGGEATVLTEGPAHDHQPLLDPDGLGLEFLSYRNGREAVFRLGSEFSVASNARFPPAEKPQIPILFVCNPSSRASFRRIRIACLASASTAGRYSFHE